MEIKYTGKFIEQYDVAAATKKELCETHKDVSENINNIINNKGDKNEELLILRDYFSKKLPESINTIESKESYINNIINFLNEFKSLKHSYNKNKGVWLEYIFKYVFERTNKFEQLSNITWQDNIIFNHFILKDIKFNNKSYSRFSTFPLTEFNNIKDLKLSFNSFEPGKVNNIISKFIKSNESFRVEYFDKILFNSQLIGEKSLYECVIKFNNLPDTDLLIKLMFKLNIFSKSIDISKLKTDLTYLDKNSNKISILECKNYEKTPLSRNEIFQAVAYGIREKVFRKSKFKEISLITTGNISRGLIEDLRIINIHLKNTNKFEVRLINSRDYLDEIKNKYFDNESKQKYTKKDITCWDFDTVIIQKNNNSSNQKGKYMYFTELNHRDDNSIVINADFEFVAPKVKVKVDKDKQDETKEDLKEMGSVFTKEVTENE